ncbi:MAG: acyl-CoA dehydrogenase family protein [Gemmatimonadaceae bacterium]
MSHASIGKASCLPADLFARAQEIARGVAAAHAASVDRDARFPTETFAALKDAGVLSAAVPVEWGGAGAGMRDLVAMCGAVAEACGSSGMVLAMHHIQVACIARHGAESPFFRRYLQEISDRQLLLASITSEVGTNGDTRSSICAIEREGDRFRLVKKATTVSYGEAADDLLVTCRRTAESPASDQILVLARDGQYALERTGNWDTMGMRGTCSPPYTFTAAGPEEQVVPGLFADSAAQSMVPFSHILWSAVWLGIATDAVARASAFVRAEARKKPGTTPPNAHCLAEASVMLQTFRHNAGGRR